MVQAMRQEIPENIGRQAVLDAAIGLICEKGYTATTLDAACKRAGVRRRSVESAFANRDALIAAVMDEVALGWITEIQSQVNMVGTPMERRDQLVAGLRYIVENRPELLRVMHVMLLATDAVGDRVRTTIMRVNDKAQEAIANGFNEALGAELEDMDLFAHTIIGIMLYAYRRKVLDPSVDLARVFDDLKVTIDAIVRDRLYRVRQHAN